jgi:SnoaL-like domain
VTTDRDIQDELAALAARVQVLEDQQALAQLVASYGPAVDSGSADATADLWFEDGVFDVVPHGVWVPKTRPVP